ncbi:MAG: zinc ABC transporter permease subunit ZnuB [Enterobacteriaceae bacterium]
MIELLLPGWMAGMILSLATGPLGSFVVWRRMSYFGDTLAHSALLGVALGFLLQVNPWYAILLVTVSLAFCLIWLEKKQQLAMDTLLGIMAHSALSLGLVMVSLMQGIRVDLMGYLFGDLLAVTSTDLLLMSAGIVLIGALLLWQWRALLCVTVNEELASVDGIRPDRVRLLLMLMTALIIALAMKFVGALLITALLIIPAATARRFAATPEQMALIAIGISCCAVTGGLLLSATYDTPAGASVVLCAAGLFVISLGRKQRVNLICRHHN